MNAATTAPSAATQKMKVATTAVAAIVAAPNFIVASRTTTAYIWKAKEF